MHAQVLRVFMYAWLYVLIFACLHACEHGCMCVFGNVYMHGLME